MAIITIPTSGVVQSLFTELTTNASTTAVDPTFSTLLTQDITTEGGNLTINFTAAFGSFGTISTEIAEFRILLDGTLQRSCGVSARGTVSRNTSIIFQVSAAQGLHTITIQWAKRSNASGTLFVRPVSFPNIEHASLLVQEVLI